MDKGLKVQVVLELFLLNLAWILALSIPMAVLVATLMAFGRLSQDNEIVAIKASGTNLYKMLAPVLMVSALLCMGMVYFNNNVLPEANHRAANLYSDISRKKPLAFVDEGMLIDDFPGYKILIKELDVKTGMMYDIRIYQEKKDGTFTTTFARRAHMKYINNRNLLQFELFDGESHEADREKKVDYYRIKFQRQVLHIQNAEDSLKRTERQRRGDREMSAVDMLMEINKRKGEKSKTLEEIQGGMENHFRETDSLLAVPASGTTDDTMSGRGAWDPQLLRKVQMNHRRELNKLQSLGRTLASKDRFISKYMVEVHKKYTIPVACIVFVLIGAPLGIMSRTGGFAMGVAYSLFFFIFWWIFLIGGEILADRLIVPPAPAMWAPNIILGCVGIILFLKVARERTIINYDKIKKVGAAIAGYFSRINLPRSKRAEGLFLKIITRYVLARFLIVLALITVGMWTVFIAVDFIGSLRHLIKGTVKDIIYYYIYFSPSILVMIFPVNMLLASMFSVGMLAKNNELKAMQTAGINPFRILAPVLLMGLLVSAGVLVFSETVLPVANERKIKVRKQDIEKRRIRNPDRRRNFFYNSDNGNIYYFKEFRLKDKRGLGVSLQFFKHNMKQVVECREMLWDEDGWIFIDGVLRTHELETTESLPFDTLSSLKPLLLEKPQDFIVKKVHPDQMNFFELQKYIESAKRAGADFRKWLVNLHMKISVPFINFIVILLGIGITFRVGRRGIAVVFGLGILITFTYFTVVKIGMVLGNSSSKIDPFLAAWMGNIMFLPLAVVLFWRNTR
jgi:lipopolysaccharide export system permease protein